MVNERLIPVLVVGAGPTGLTTANELVRHGTAVRIIDRAPVPPITSRALVVMPRSLEIFDDMGLIDDAIAAGNPATAITITFTNKKVRF
ncbi:MAG: FAD-dependent monooxygenase [Mycobacterium sp.]